MDCLFCRIVAGSVPADKVYEDDQAVAFTDIHPGAPTHILIVPRRHVAGLDVAAPEDVALVGRLQLTAAELARQLGLTGGYRTVINVGADAGQSVDHLHVHLLGGRGLGWPPG